MFLGGRRAFEMRIKFGSPAIQSVMECKAWPAVCPYSFPLCPQLCASYDAIKALLTNILKDLGGGAGLGKASHMTEQTFTYAYFDTFSYFFAALAMGYSLMVFMPVLAVPLLIIYAILCFSVLLYRFFRIVRLTQKYKYISAQDQRQMIKRHRYAFRWILPILLVSIAITFLCTKLFALDLVQSTGAWGLSLMLLLFLEQRVFLRGLKSQTGITIV